MSLGSSGDAMRAKAELAKRHARELREEAGVQSSRAASIRAAELAAAARARAELAPSAEVLGCDRCGAVWRGEAIRAAMRRRPVCLMCGGRLRPVADD